MPLKLSCCERQNSNDKFEAGLISYGATLNDKAPDGWNILHENIAMGTEAIKLQWIGKGRKNRFSAKTDIECLDAFELQNIVRSRKCNVLKQNLEKAAQAIDCIIK